MRSVCWKAWKASKCNVNYRFFGHLLEFRKLGLANPTYHIEDLVESIPRVH